MRVIGHLSEEATARTFGDYLYVQGIDNQVEHQAHDGWAIWVLDEDKLDSAGRLLTEFRTNPSDQKYKTEGRKAAELHEKEKQDDAAYRKKVRDRRHLFRPLTPYGFGPLTFALIVGSVTVFFVSDFANNLERIRSLFLTDPLMWMSDNSLPEIRHGQIWRLFTPMFIHFSPLHILFNMLWLRDLGSMIEGRQSSLHLLALVLVISGCSNLAQCYIGMKGPHFGGMSGVVYGLLGYVWMRGKFDPGSGLFLHPTTVWMMIIWFIACFAGVIPNVANTVHAVGLGIGLAWGYLSSLRYR